MATLQRVHFAKHWSDIQTQLSVLASRGLIIADPVKALEFLSYINYYRFTGYCLRFQLSPNVSGVRTFAAGVTFEDVVHLCTMDRDLRDVFSQGLELVEISTRAAIADEFGKAYDALGHLDANNFAPSFSRLPHGADPSDPTPFDRWREKLRSEVRRSRELFVTHFQRTYLEYPDLPIWMSCEIASFGSISKLYENMKRAEQRAISNRYGLQPGDMDSWLHAFVYLRNVCAHHARLWDKSLSITPSVPPGHRWDAVRQAPNNSLYVAAMTLNWMLTRGSVPKSAADTWRNAFSSLMDSFEKRFPAFVSATGFPPGWRQLQPWQ